MAPGFGTSGLRGLVAELTPELVAAHVRAFLSVCDCGGCLCIGRDLRPSSTRIAADVIRATTAAGIEVVDCGALPTPALALAAALRGCGAVMITGSHIPADRNGLKFYTVSGEITKAGEAAIVRALGFRPQDAPPASVPATVTSDREAGQRFVDRYLRAFGPSELAGRRIGHFAHSAVGRDLVGAILSGLGAEVVELGRSDDFIAVDTEAIETATNRRIAGWVADLGLDALVSIDGDSDRPLLADETGRIVPGDILGQIAAEMLGADTVVTPVSSGSGVTMKNFGRVIRTRIGSPYVIAALNEAGGRGLGYEANGGLILGFAADGPAGPLGPLPTRDSILPLLTALVAAAGGPVSARVAAEPEVVTLSCRLPDIAPDDAAPDAPGREVDHGRAANATSTRLHWWAIRGVLHCACAGEERDDRRDRAAGRGPPGDVSRARAPGRPARLGHRRIFVILAVAAVAEEVVMPVTMAVPLFFVFSPLRRRLGRRGVPSWVTGPAW